MTLRTPWKPITSWVFEKFENNLFKIFFFIHLFLQWKLFADNYHICLKKLYLYFIIINSTDHNWFKNIQSFNFKIQFQIIVYNKIKVRFGTIDDSI